jgi:hypothetical protein
MPIDLNPKCQESTAFRLKKLILYEYWNHDNDFGLAIECFNVFKERNTDRRDRNFQIMKQVYKSNNNPQNQHRN